MTTMAPPISPQTSHQSRPRPVTMASHHSTKSWRSSSSGNKLDMTETSRDKRRLNAKSDPTQALREAQPAAIALEDSSLDNLRAVQHKDNDGNVIADPDRSNPTRHRMERPLDTIRSFNAAADGTSNRRSSYGPRPSPNFGQDQSYNRRSGYYNNNVHGPPSAGSRPRPFQGGYYRPGGSYGMKTEHVTEEFSQNNIPYGRPPRQNPVPYYEGGESPNSRHSYGHSYETMTSGSDEYGRSTNPSSQNSSYDRLHQLHMQRNKAEEYPHNQDEIQYAPPQGHAQALDPYGPPNGHYSHHPQQPSQMNTQYGAPLPSARQPIKLNTGSGPPPSSNRYEKPLPAQKRQSWIKRTFSRRGS